jgi:signal transduction histidine kinase
MLNPEEIQVLSHIDRLTQVPPTQQRAQLLTAWNLLTSSPEPICDEVTRLVAEQLNPTVCVLGFMTDTAYHLKSAIGLCQMDGLEAWLCNRTQSTAAMFFTEMAAAHQPVVISNTTHPHEFTNHPFIHRFQIQALLSIPLTTASGACLGALTLLETQPRHFTSQNIAYLEILARWCMCELERRQLQRHEVKTGVVAFNQGGHAGGSNGSIPAPNYQAVKFELTSQLTQELRSPLTPVMGMTSVLRQEVYGTLTAKQREYLDVVYQSSQTLLSVVNEILDLSAIDEASLELNTTTVDVEMLCQQAISALAQKTQQREQQVRLSVEPAARIWHLDREKIRLTLYHLVGGIILAASPGSTICIHMTRSDEHLRIAVWATHPWIGDGLRQSDLALYHHSSKVAVESSPLPRTTADSLNAHPGQQLDTSPMRKPSSKRSRSQDLLRVILSRKIAAMHGGKIMLQGSSDTGYRFIVTIPELPEAEDGAEAPSH